VVLLNAKKLARLIPFCEFAFPHNKAVHPDPHNVANNSPVISVNIRSTNKEFDSLSGIRRVSGPEVVVVAHA